jgi:hypothetical protein
MIFKKRTISQKVLYTDAKRPTSPRPTKRIHTQPHSNHHKASEEYTASVEVLPENYPIPVAPVVHSLTHSQANHHTPTAMTPTAMTPTAMTPTAMTPTAMTPTAMTHSANHTHKSTPSSTHTRAISSYTQAKYERSDAQRQSHHISHQQTAGFPFMGNAISMSVSRQTVIYDGQNTHIEAEQQSYVNGQWTRTHAEGTWEGDQSQQAIRELIRK